MASWKIWLRDGWEGVVGLLTVAPHPCPFCGGPRHLDPGRERSHTVWAGELSRWACSDCLEQLPFVVPPVCQLCGRPLRQTRGELCHDCQSSRRFFSRCRAMGVYDGALREWIHLIKYGGRVDLGRALGGLLAEMIRHDPGLRQADRLVAVPASRERVAARGYDQALLLAQACATELGRPVCPEVVARVGNAPPQSLLHTAARRRNAMGQFAVARPGVVAGHTVLVVDDIFTTGATLAEVSRLLLRAGARQVVAAAVAIGVQRGD